MKTIVILGDGMSDRPVAALGGKTPLEVADKPNIDRIAREGRTGIFQTIPEGMPNGSAVANLQVLGYDSRETFNGRGTLEAASMKVKLEPDDVAMRINLISLDNGNISDHSAGHISNHEGAQLIEALYEELRQSLGEKPFRMYPGFDYRHLLVLNDGWADPGVDCFPPHDHLGHAAGELMPRPFNGSKKASETTKFLIEMIDKSREFLASHPVNLKRKAEGKAAADSLWPWSPGRRPDMKTLGERFGVRPAVISAVDLVKGLGIYAGADIIEVPGATGLHDTNYEGKAQAALDALKTYDFLYVHVEATDEAGHARDVDLKIKCVEMLDRRLVAPILEGLEKQGTDAVVAVLPDHPTLVETGSHGNDPVPVAVRVPGVEPDHVRHYTEKSCAEGSLGMLSDDEFIRGLLQS